MIEIKLNIVGNTDKTLNHGYLGNRILLEGVMVLYRVPHRLVFHGDPL